MRPRLSVREAARRADLSDSRWRQIVQGFQVVSGTPVPFHAPAETIARMATVVGLTSIDLRAAGRSDAADALQDLLLDEKYGDKTNEELRAETIEIAREVAETVRRLGLDLDARQDRVLRRWARRLIEDLIDEEASGEPDEGHEAS